jgi:predicted MFS family arabinose efflux permease
MLSKRDKILIIGAFLGVFATIGITRMSFGMVLPLIKNDLNISTTIAGFISASNFIGYFVGVFFASYFYHKFTIHKLFLTLITLEVIFMLLMTASDNYLIISIFFLSAGFISAIGYMAIMSYITQNIKQEYKGRALGVAISGNSLAIVFSGLSVWTLGVFDNFSFNANWIVFAITTFFIAIIVSLMIKDNNILQNVKSTTGAKFIFSQKYFWQMSLIYLIFGINYTVFLTYFVSVIMQNFQISLDISTNFWIILGIISLFSGPIFGMLADKVGVYKTFIIVFILQSLANLSLISGVENNWVIYFSAFCFGISVWATPSLMFLLSANYFGAKNASKPTAFATLFFAAGQIIGPASGGYLYDKNNSYDIVFAITFTLTLIAVILSFVYSRQTKNIKQKIIS